MNNECKTCNGQRVVDDGEITQTGGVAYENGPVQCVKDCPDCAPVPPAGDVEVRPVLWFKPLPGVLAKSNGQCYDVVFAEIPGYQALYAAPVCPANDRESLRDAIAHAIGGDAYDCIRVWEAWGVGTMSEDDFVPITDQEERLDDIVDACLGQVTRLTAERDGLLADYDALKEQVKRLKDECIALGYVSDERDALQSELTKARELNEHLSIALGELDSTLRVVAVAGSKTALSSLRTLAKRSLNVAHGLLSDQSAPAAKGGE